jgi:hypothetical protein
MAHEYVCLNKKAHSSLVNTAFNFECEIKEMHSWTETDYPHAQNSTEQEQTKIKNTINAANKYHQKYHEQLSRNYSSLVDHTLVAHVKDIIHVLNCWNVHVHFQDQHHFCDTYIAHRRKYDAYTSTEHGMHVWYGNPLHKTKTKHTKGARPEKSKEDSAHKPHKEKRKRNRTRKGNGGGAKEAHAGLAPAVVVHPSPDGSEFTGRGGELESLMRQLKVN